MNIHFVHLTILLEKIVDHELLSQRWKRVFWFLILNPAKTCLWFMVKAMLQIKGKCTCGSQFPIQVMSLWWPIINGKSFLVCISDLSYIFRRWKAWIDSHFLLHLYFDLWIIEAGLNVNNLIINNKCIFMRTSLIFFSMQWISYQNIFISENDWWLVDWLIWRNVSQWLR